MSSELMRKLRLPGRKEDRGVSVVLRSLSLRRHSVLPGLVCHAVLSILGVVSLWFQGLIVEEDEFDYYY
jgi:hypothetical protein